MIRATMVIVFICIGESPSRFSLRKGTLYILRFYCASKS